MDKRQRLKQLLATMDVPPARLELSEADIRWLGRNIGVRNSGHAHFREAVQLLFELLPTAMHVWHRPATK